jgi:hypothetical protein
MMLGLESQRTISYSQWNSTMSFRSGRGRPGYELPSLRDQCQRTTNKEHDVRRPSSHHSCSYACKLHQGRKKRKKSDKKSLRRSLHDNKKRAYRVRNECHLQSKDERAALDLFKSFHHTIEFEIALMFDPHVYNEAFV